MIKIKRILCPTDLSETSLTALPYAVELARLFNAEIFLVHVIPPLPSISEYQGSYAEVCEKYLVYLRTDADIQIDKILLKRIPEGIKATKVIREEAAAEEIKRIVGDLKIDLITIATHGYTGWQHLVFGSVAEKVIRTSMVPVLTVRETAGESDQ